MKKIILASQSPRRAEILKKAQIVFVSFPVSISEIPNKNLSLDEQILDIARRKAREADRLLSTSEKSKVKHEVNSIILASDTMVCFENQAIGKAENRNEAFETLKKLSDNTHFVKTAIILLDLETKKEISHIETSEVKFKKLSDHEINNYLSTQEYVDKAGSYAIQGLGKSLVEKFIGDYDNIVGLPLNALKNIIEKNKIQLMVESDLKNFIDQSEFNQICISIKNTQVQILAVSKLQSIEKILALHHQGQTHFAENYIQEALEKINFLKHLNLNWHLIGPIQKNKVKYLKNNFTYIHSVDSIELLNLINEKAKEINYKQKTFLQVNLSAEETKSGFSKEELKKAIKSVHNSEFSHIQVVGLMTMPPLQNEAEENRTYFSQLATLAQDYILTELSMGTSHDYLVAIEERATWVRLGTLLFGERS